MSGPSSNILNISGSSPTSADPSLDAERMPPQAVKKEQPTLEDLFYDESLDDVGRIVRYGRSILPLQRLVHVRMMALTAAREG
jgi:hypothetical protein